MREGAAREARNVIPTVPGVSGSLDMQQMASILPSFIDALTDAVAVVDREQRVVATNRRYREAFGDRGTLELAGQPCQQALNCPEGPATPGTAPCAAREVFDFGHPQRRVRTVHHADGTSRRWEGSFSPIRDASGHLTHVVEVWRDLSERTALEAQLAHSERLASIGILAAGVGHEINNPLASIMACLESLDRIFETGSESAGDYDEGREICSMLEREVDRCRETTQKLMLLAQPLSAAPGLVDLNRAASDALSLLRFQARKQGVELVETLDADLPRIWAIESGIRSVCLNLVMNAVQAMTEGGTLHVRTARHEGMVELVVADTGPGIASEHLDRIWDPFFTTKPPGQGTGLGLSVSERIVKRHGGRIRAENRAEHGARFVVHLPVGPAGREIQ